MILVKTMKFSAWAGVTSVCVLGFGAMLPKVPLEGDNPVLARASELIKRSEVTNIEMTVATGKEAEAEVKEDAKYEGFFEALSRGEARLTTVAADRKGWMTTNATSHWGRGFGGMSDIAIKPKGTTTERYLRGIKSEAGKESLLNAARNVSIFNSVLGSGCTSGGAAKFCSVGR